MRDVEIDANGALVCPYCGNQNLDRERTGKGKTTGFLTVGVGVFLVPKRLHCLVCGRYSKSGNARQVEPARGAATTSRPVAQPTRAVTRQPAQASDEYADLVLVDPGAKRIGTIKIVREVTGWGLKEAVRCVDAARGGEPQVIMFRVTNDEANEVAQALEANGAVVEVHGAREREEMFDSRDASDPNAFDDLAAIADLHDRGVLTDDEYEAAKRKLLDKI